MVAISDSLPTKGTAIRAITMMAVITIYLIICCLSMAYLLFPRCGRKQSVRPQGQNDQQHEIGDQHLHPGAKDITTEQLGNTEDDATGQGADNTPHPADNHDPEGDDQVLGAARRIEDEGRTDQGAGQSGDAQCDNHGIDVGAAGVDPHQLGGHGVIGSGTDRAAEVGLFQHIVQADDDDHPDDEAEQVHG